MSQLDQISSEMDAQWVLSSAFLVLFMQTGFAMLEAGTVSSNNIQNILFKNLIDMCIGCMMFFLCGYALAFGKSISGIFGWSHFALVDFDLVDYPAWFFQFTFASAAATIVSGAVAGRCKIEAYFVYSVLVSGFVYPLAVHWVWSSGGWLYKMGFIDFAGSGVVHTTGGCIALMGAVTIGPRLNRFVQLPNGTLGEPRPNIPNNVLMQTLGVFILWFGWYGFNAGSTAAVSDGAIFIAARVAVTTTLSAAAATCVSIPFGKYFLGYFDLGLALNCALAGLVSITAGCAEVSPVAAVIIGGLGSIVYMLTSGFVLRSHIDDPLDAFSIHGACGVWALLATGIFAPDATFKQFGVQVLGAVVLVGWAVLCAAIIFKLCELSVGLRVSTEVEIAGIDIHEHGGAAISTAVVYSLDDILERRALRKALHEYMKSLFSEESLDFLLECREFFAQVDVDSRIEYMSEERESLPSQQECKEQTWDLITHLIEMYIVVGSPKEININSSLNKHIISCFKGKHLATVNENDSFNAHISSKMLRSVKAVFGGSLRINRVASADASTDASTDGSKEKEGVQDDLEACSGGTVQLSTMPTDVQEFSAFGDGEVRTPAYHNTFGEENVPLKAPQTVSRELTRALMDAYCEVHTLVFQNFYGKFCQTPSFTKAAKRYSKE